MTFIKKKKNNQTLIKQLSWMNGIVISATFCVVLIILEMLYAGIITQKEERMMNTYLVNSLGVADDKMKDMGRVSLVCFANTEICGILRNYRNYDYRERLESEDYLRDFYTSLISIRDDIDGIYIFDTENLIFWRDFIASTYNSDYPIEEYMRELEKISAEKGKISGCHLRIGPSLDFMNYMMSYGEGQFFYLSRSIQSFSPYERIGYIVLSAKEQVFSEIFEENLEEKALFYLLSEDGKIVSFQRNAEVNGNREILEQSFQEETGGQDRGNFWKIFNGSLYLFSFFRSDYSGLTLVTGKAAADIYAGLLESAVYVLILLGIISFITMLAIVQCTRKRLRPLGELSGVMSRFSVDNIDFRFSVNSRDEIGTCMQSFNEMQDTIKQLMEEEYRNREKLHDAQIRQQKTSLLYLKNQVNPHFLYNTLDTIRIRAELNGDKETAYMILQLVHFFRLNVKADQQFVTVSHEIRLLTAYMNLMRYRYDKLQFECRVEENLEELLIPNFMLQPLVENALMHGLRNLGYKGLIRVVVTRDAAVRGYIRISVYDNGIGLTKERKDMLDDMLKSCDSDYWRQQEETHIGVLNVQRRLKMYYSEECGLSYRVNPEGGVTAEILLRDQIQEDISRKGVTSCAK